LELALAEVLEAPVETPAPIREEKSAPAKAAKKETPVKTKAPTAEAVSSPVQSDIVPKVDDEAPQAAAAVIGLAEVVKVWRDIRSVIKPDHPGIEALLNSCKPLEVRGSDLYLGFQSETVRALMDMPEKVQIAQEAIKEVLGVDLAIKCVVTNAKGQLPPDVNPDGMVAAAIQNGGEIVDVQE